MATMVVRMALDSQGVPVGDGGRTSGWVANGNADFGYCVRNPTNNVSSQLVGGSPGASLGFFLDSGDLTTLAAAVGAGTIDSVTATVEHMIDPLLPGPPAPTRSVDILRERPDTLNFGLFGNLLPSNVVSSQLTYITQSTSAKTTDPVGGAAWTIAKLQAYVFFLELFNATPSSLASVYHCDLFYVTVAYTPPAPTEVDVTGQGGMELGGAATITQGRIVNGQGGVMLGRSSAGAAFGAGTGPAAELHLNQWGLEAFMLDTDRNEHLG